MIDVCAHPIRRRCHGRRILWCCPLLQAHPDGARRSVGTADLKDALDAGIADFWVVPSRQFFLLVIYPVIGLVAGRGMARYDVLPRAWPLLADFTLVGPVVATGMYELSRRAGRVIFRRWRTGAGGRT